MKKMKFSTTSASYIIQVAEPSCLKHILQIMRDNFYYEETMFCALSSVNNITEDEKKLINENFDATIIAAFNISPCLVAVHKETKKIVGVNLMTISKNPKFDGGSDGLSTIFASDKPKSKLVDKYFYYLMDINDKANLFVKYPNVKAMLEFYSIAVAKEHRRVGLAENLLSAGISMARDIDDVSLVFGVFTSLYSTRSAEKAGMSSLLQFNLLDYKNNGETPFATTVPHNIVSLMILQV